MTARTELGKLDARVDEIAMAQLSEVTVDGVTMRAQKLAELVVAGHEQYGWFEDEVALAPENSPPLSEEEAGQLREARRKLGADLVYVRGRDKTNRSSLAYAITSEARSCSSTHREIDAAGAWASWHVQNGTPLHVFQELGGWSCYTMVQRYAHLSAEHLAEYAGNVSKLRACPQHTFGHTGGDEGRMRLVRESLSA